MRHETSKLRVLFYAGSHRRWILPYRHQWEDLERWSCNLYLRSHEVHADFETLNIYGKSLLRFPNGHAVLDIMDYDEKHVLDDPIFQPFVTGKKGSSALLAFEAVIPKDTFLSDRLARNDDEETIWVQEAIRSGTKGIYSKKVTTELDRLARTYRTMFADRSLRRCQRTVDIKLGLLPRFKKSSKLDSCNTTS